MFAVQQPLAYSAFNEVMGTPALEVPAIVVHGRRVRRGDSPEAERSFAQRMGAVTVEASSSHVAMVSQSRRGC